MLNLDLFGGETPIPGTLPRAPKMGMKQKIGFRNATDKHRCGSCKNFFRTRHHNRGYMKCRLLGDSRSAATDVKRSGVCNRFEVGKEGGK